MAIFSDCRAVLCTLIACSGGRLRPRALLRIASWQMAAQNLPDIVSGLMNTAAGFQSEGLWLQVPGLRSSVLIEAKDGNSLGSTCCTLYWYSFKLLHGKRGRNSRMFRSVAPGFAQYALIIRIVGWLLQQARKLCCSHNPMLDT